MWASLGFLVCAVGLWHRTLVSRAGAVVAAGAVMAGLLLLVAYSAIDRLTGSGIDESVLYHLQTGLAGAGLAEFSGLAAATAAATLGTIAAAVLAYRLIRADSASSHATTRLLLGMALLSGAFWVNPAVGDLSRLIGGIIRQETTSAGPSPPGFVPVERAEFTENPRSFVLLYLESIERSYLDEARFPGLMPNLAALESEALSFTDLTEVEGAGWTIAGMVASQCGMPLIGSGSGVDRFLPGATCLGDLLPREGYDLAYIGGADLGFAGKGRFYDDHGFLLIEGRTELQPRLEDPDYVHDWGLYDDSLYPEVIRRFDALAAADRPFGLVTLTLDTHHPFGFLSRSCTDRPYSDGSNQFLNAVHCADLLAAEFIRHVRSSPAFKDTVLIVASDHLAMPNLARERLESGPRRNLLMVFAPDLPPALVDKPGTTLDIGPTLLGLIGAPTPALGFGRDLLAEAPTLRDADPGLEALIAAGRSYLVAMWSFPGIERGLSIDRAAGEVILGERRLKYPVLFRLDEALKVSAMNFALHSDISLTDLVARLPLDQRILWLDTCSQTGIFAAAPAPDGAELCLLAGSLASPDLRQTVVEDTALIPVERLTEPFTRSSQEVDFHDALLDRLNRRRQFVTANVIDYTPPNGLTGATAIRSAGYPSGDSWAMNPAMGNRVKLMRGLTLLGLTPDADPANLGHVDTCGYGGKQSDSVPLETGFQAAIEANADAYGAFAIVAHSSVVCYQIDPGLEPLFDGTGLTKWRDLWYDQPYVAVIAGNGEVQEFVGDRRTALGVDLKNFMRAPRQDSQRQLGWLPRIVVAGEAQSGQTDLKALEALVASGAAFDLIEIDLAWTADSQLVCLRDWDASSLALNGSTPDGSLPLAEVISRAVAHARVPPCTLQTLADWLGDHPGVRIVLDVTSGTLDAYRHIAKTYPDLRHRLIPQFHQPEDYGRLRDLGFADVIWSLRQDSGDASSVLAKIRRMDLLGLTMPSDRLELGLARQAREATGVLSWADRINTVAELDAALQAGAAEVVTDALRPRVVARFEAISSGFLAGTSTLRTKGGRRLKLARGVNLIDLTPGTAPDIIATFDGCAALDTGSAPDPAPFRDALTEAVAEGMTLAVMVHDSAFCEGTSLASLFAGSPLKRAPEVEFRAPYIGLIRADGRVLEVTGSAGSRLLQTLTVETTP